VFNSAQHKHANQLPLSCCVSCLRKRVRDYIIHCSMQRTLSVINNLLYFLLTFPDSYMSATHLNRDKFQRMPLSVKASLASCYWRCACRTREATVNKNAYNLHSTCSSYETKSLLTEVDVNSNSKIKKHHMPYEWLCPFDN